MNRMISVTLTVLAGGLSAAGQIPPAPPAAPAPHTAPAPHAAPAPPHPLDLDIHIDVERIKEEALSRVHFQLDEVRARAEEMKQRGREMALMAQNNFNFQVDKQMTGARPGSEDSRYRQGLRLLDERQWERAVDSFSEVVSRGSSRADAALYWKAYALHKLGRRPEAQAALAELAKAHPNSGWLNDSKALSVEVSQASGQPVSPESQNDEELKLIALNGLVHSDPERAVPLLEKLLQGSNSPKMKERAVYVLAQSGSARGREVITQMARGKSNPDLQVKALQYLGTMLKGAESRQVLAEIYGASSSLEVKRTILQGFKENGDRERLLNAAKSESAPELRREAIQLLGNMRADAELLQVWQSETNADYKRDILRAMRGAGNTDKLIEIAKSEKDAKLRAEAIRSLNSRKETKTGDIVAALYAGEADAGVRKEILRVLASQNNVKQLVEIARKESDASLKREAVQSLANMKSKEAADFLLELLNK